MDQKLEGLGETNVFEDPLPFVERFRALTWMHELLGNYKVAFDSDSLKTSFKLFTKVTHLFTVYIHKMKFVTMKQTEL